YFVFFFFSSRRRHTRSKRDWSSDVCSSDLERGDVYKLRVWYAVTIMLGLIFICIVGYEWYEMIHHGVTIQSSVFGSVFYILTGFHAIHVSAVIVAFIVIMMRTAKSKFTPAQATAAMAVSYYWHFVDVIWIGVFVVIYLVQ